MEIHGGNIYDKQINLDYSISINPFGLPEKVRREAIRGVELSEHYPDVNCTRLLDEMEAAFLQPRERLIIGNGESELIYAAACAAKPKKALILGPTFVEYERAFTATGCAFEYYFAKEETDFVVQDEILDILSSGKYDMFVVCNPNNPTGRLVKRRLMAPMMELCREKGIRVMLDECFMDFVRKETEHTYIQKLDEYPNILILRTFTKTFAMPGLRLGYALSSDTGFIDRMKSVLPPWNVSVPAQYAGVAAMREKEFIVQTKEFVSSERRWMEDRLKALEYPYFTSKANFILFRADGRLRDFCLASRILIRDAGNIPGLSKGFYRIGVKRRNCNERLFKVLEQAKRAMPK